jgi:hypothetical protein
MSAPTAGPAGAAPSVAGFADAEPQHRPRKRYHRRHRARKCRAKYRNLPRLSRVHPHCLRGPTCVLRAGLIDLWQVNAFIHLPRVGIYKTESQARSVERAASARARRSSTNYSVPSMPSPRSSSCFSLGTSGTCKGGGGGTISSNPGFGSNDGSL